MSHHNKPFLPEIQGLRCWAVLLVVVYHLWPSVLPGGFVGVDVFFVISGFLITGLLIREAEREGRISLLGFYARRILRLLPMATLVLLAVVAALPLMSPSRWQETSLHVAASTLYAENWWLAHQAVDYLGSEELPSPLQHYWSLSIEEQFYFIWPLLIILGGWLGKWRGLPVRTVAVVILSGLTLVSFAVSVWLTYHSPKNAYFFTHTRLWELGMGGLLALSLYRPGYRCKPALAMAGLAAIVASALLISAKSPFPGYIALLPVSGTVMVILSGGAGRFSHYTLNARPYQFIGDLSYSLYLWHWPVIIYYTARKGPPGFMGLVLLAGVVLLSWLSKRYIEDYFLKRVRWRTKRWCVYLFGACLIGASLSAAAVVYWYTARDSTASLSEADYPGALSLTHGRIAPTGMPMQPPAVAISKDVPDVYKRGCHVRFADTQLKPCEYGNKNAPLHIMLIGDSHAAHWVPAFAELAKRNGWHLTSNTKAGCVPVELPMEWKGDPYPECTAWMKNLNAEILRARPDIVVQSQLYMMRPMGTPAGDRDARVPDMVSDMHRLWRGWQQQGIAVVAIPDTPIMPKEMIACIAKQSGDCTYDRADSLRRVDPLEEAAKTAPDVTLLDMNDTICNTPVCHAVIGNVVVFRDYNHLSKTYSHTIARSLGERLEPVVQKALKRKAD